MHLEIFKASFNDTHSLKFQTGTANVQRTAAGTVSSRAFCCSRTLTAAAEMACQDALIPAAVCLLRSFSALRRDTCPSSTRSPFTELQVRSPSRFSASQIRLQLNSCWTRSVRVYFYRAVVCCVVVKLSSVHLQVVATTGNPSAHILCEEKVPLLKERSEVKRCAQYRFLAPEEEVVRLVSSWDMEEGYVGRICLKTKEEVLKEEVQAKFCHVESGSLLWRKCQSSHLTFGLFFTELE